VFGFSSAIIASNNIVVAGSMARIFGKRRRCLHDVVSGTVVVC
jgi:hypothetical protein